MSALRCGEGNTGNAGPGAEGGGNQEYRPARPVRIGLKFPWSVKYCTEPFAQIRAWPSTPGVVAGARDKGRASGAAGNGTANHENGNRQNSPAHVHSFSLLALRMARSS